MESSSNWVAVNWLKALVAVLGFFLCALSFLLLAGIDDPPPLVVFVMAALPSAAVVLIAYLLGSYLLFRKGISGVQQLREEIVEAVAKSHPVQGVAAVYSDFGSPPWNALWSEAREVVLVARFFDGIVKEVVPDLESFWRQKDATIKVVIPDPRSAAALRSLDHQRDGSLVREDALGRLLRGLWVIEQSRASQDAPESALAIYLAEDAIPYAGHCFDNEHLLLKAYEYQLEPTDRFPRSHFLLSGNQALARFWQAEMKEFTLHPQLTFSAVKELIEEARSRGGESFVER